LEWAQAVNFLIFCAILLLTLLLTSYVQNKVINLPIKKWAADFLSATFGICFLVFSAISFGYFFIDKAPADIKPTHYGTSNGEYEYETNTVYDRQGHYEN